MKTSPDYQAAYEIAKTQEYRMIPVSFALYSDFITPITALRILKNVSKHCFLLESAEPNQTFGRYSFLGYDPKLTLTCKNHLLTIKSGVTITETAAHPKEYIRKVLADHKSPKMPGLPTFTGGLVGYFSYDYQKYAERGLDVPPQEEDDFCDVDLMLFDQVIAFDHYHQKIILIANLRVPSPFSDEAFAAAYHKAEFELAGLQTLLEEGAQAKEKPSKLLSPLTPLFDQQSYCNMVERGKQYIREGDIFQVVLSNRLDAAFSGGLLDTYRALRANNPSPYMFYFSGDAELAGASPETLTKLTGGTVSTYPLAGTRPRGKTGLADKETEKELLSDEKELAEHNMLVDLGRNDLGKICRFGSVQVTRYKQIERFSKVMHIGSTVAGTLADGFDALDAVDAVLPAGTLSGAPKLRACEIIRELEQNPRGIYGGAVGYLDFAGNMDLCIAIRFAYLKEEKLSIRAGAGIVFDSVPQKEYEECLHKAGAVIDAVNEAVAMRQAKGESK